MAYSRKHHIGHKIRSLKKQEKIWKKRWFWIGIGGALVMAAAFYSFYFLPFLQVKNIIVSGNERMPHDEIQKFVDRALSAPVMGIPTRSILLKSPAALSGNILKQFPGIESAWVRKQYPATISISIKERKEFAIFCKEAICFSIDEKGIIFKEASKTDGGIIITAEGKDGIATGERAVENNAIALISAIQKSLKENFNLAVTHASVSNFLVLTTKEGWKIHVNPKDEPASVIAKAEALLKGISVGARKNLRYIYLQYQDRAYYK